MCIVHHLISESGPTYHDIFFEGNFKKQVLITDA